MLWRIINFRLSVLSLGAALLLVAVGRVAAGPAIGVAPALIQAESRKGTASLYPISVFNDGDQPMEVEGKVYDFKLDPAGHVVFLPGSKKKRTWSAASWLLLSDAKFTVPPRSEKKLWVRVLSSPRAEPGTHRALISFSTELSPTGREAVFVNASVSTVVLVKVAGRNSIRPVINLQVPKVVWSEPAAVLTLGNRGNAHYFAEGKVTFFDRKGQKKSSYPLKSKPPAPMVLPKAQRIFTVDWPRAPYIGFFTAKAEVRTTGGKRSLSATRKFFIIRWQFLVGSASIVALGALAYYFFSRYELVKRPSQ